MSDRDERQIWNEKYAGDPGSWREPDPFLLQAFAEHIGPAFPDPSSSIALDLAGGAGRHAIYLASQLWPVELMDISETGLGLARTRAGQAGVDIRTVCVDLQRSTLPASAYDLILVFYYLQRDLFPAVEAALRPGGILVYRTFTTEQKDFVGGPRDEDFLLRPNELLHAVPGLRVLQYRETVSDNATAELIARKEGAA
ncbi:MAG: methyltransferase domain-containing protein [Acidobacteriales bacterium]|nr:methyltransferase domain-containing protein [Terriglobales bacterium]